MSDKNTPKAHEPINDLRNAQNYIPVTARHLAAAEEICDTLRWHITAEAKEQLAAIIAKHEQGANERGRESFEKWATSPPYERTIHRFSDDETQHAWPGQYRDIAVQLAWEAWQAAESLPSLEELKRDTSMFRNLLIRDAIDAKEAR